MLKLKLQYFGHLMQTDASLEKSLMLEKTEGRSRRRCQKMRCNKHNVGKPWEVVRHREAWHVAVPGSQRVACTWAIEQQPAGMCQIESEQKRTSPNGDRVCIFFSFSQICESLP